MGGWAAAPGHAPLSKVVMGTFTSGEGKDTRAGVSHDCPFCVTSL